jgi:hypothetical protein
VTLFPEPGRTPLATLGAGTQVQVLSAEQKGWYQISFQDGYLFGERVGYVRVEHVTLSAPSTATSAGRSETPASADTTADPPPANGVASATPVDPAPYSNGRISRHGLSADTIAAAILVGHRQESRAQGLGFLDTGQTWTQLVTPSGTGPKASTGFRLRLHTPLAWIRQLASDAAREYRRFTLDEVTEEMTQPVLRVTAYSTPPDIVTAGGTAGKSWVRHVVLRSRSKDVIVQPLSKEAYSEHVVNALGGRAVSEGLRLTFPIDAVRELRGPLGDAEFFITVIVASGEETNLKVTKKHFADLPM